MSMSVSISVRASVFWPSAGQVRPVRPSIRVVDRSGWFGSCMDGANSTCGHNNPTHFPPQPQEDLVAEIEAAGFKSASYSNYTLGAVAVHSGFKFV